MIAAAVSAIGPQDEAAARTFLAAAPYENVYLDWLLRQRPAARERMYAFRNSGRSIRGVAFFGRQTVLAADSLDAITAFADLARDFEGERMIVAPREIAHQYWSRIHHWHRPARLVRDRQPVFVLSKAPDIRDSNVIVRHAKPSEAGEVARNSAAMIEQELGYDPRRSAGDFFDNVDHMIAQDLWWVATSDEELCFFCHVGPSSSHTVQLQGVWTPPNLRRRGLAAQALAQICARLLHEYPSVSLYVNDFNEAAIALYRKLGFVERGALATYLF
ncbi:MAG: GNAT family N-acetyltransferase [Candidatus Eremiobacteraeota bacterium]|nr:GNAT family N-acetyltransferase [Candidatus Eremiobacteraeota bacterium]